MPIGRIVKALPGIAGPPGRSAVFTLLAGATLPADLTTVTVTTNPSLANGDLLFCQVRGAQCWLSRSGGVTTLRRHLPAQDSSTLVAGETLVIQQYNYNSFALAATVVIPAGTGGGTVQINLPAPMPVQNSAFKVQIKGYTGLLTKISGATAFSFVPDAALPAPISLVATIDFFITTASTITIPPAETTPSWLPTPGGIVPNFYADFIKGHFYWGGLVRTLSDLTPHPNFGYTLDYGDWWDSVNGATIVFDIDNGTLSAAPTGFALSFLSASNQRIDFSPQAIGPTPSGAIRTGMSGYTSATSPANFLDWTGQNYRGRGINRYCLAIKNGEPGLNLVNNMEVTPLALGNWTVEQPTKIGFSNWCLSGQNIPLQNAILRRVIIYKGQYSQPFLDAVGAAGDAPAIHTVGDSFLNGSFFLEELMLRINAAYGYVPVSNDNLGGRSLAEQAALCAAYSGTKAKWRNVIKLILDGGLSDSWQVALTSIAQIAGIGNQKHLFLYLESASTDIVNGPGDVNWDTWYNAMQRLSNRLGRHFVPTHLPAMSWASSSTADQAQIAKQLWPLSLLTSAVDFHPSETLGHQMLSQQAFLALLQWGWLQ